MSYNIDSSEYLKGKLTISRENFQEIMRQYGDDFPEGNFIDDLEKVYMGTVDDPMTIEKFEWSGEGSGRSYDDLLEILKLTKGQATIHFVWEGGDSQSALEVIDGRVSKRKVKIEVE